MDFFTVPTAGFKVLYVLVILNHERRKVVHFNVTESPSSKWTAQQVIEAFPWDTVPKYLMRDRDSIYSEAFTKRVKGMGIEEVISAYRSPWQNPFVERLIGSIRRDCLNHMIILNEGHLKRILKSYFEYYHNDRTHLGLDKDAPIERTIQQRPGKSAKVIKFPRVGEVRSPLSQPPSQATARHELRRGSLRWTKIEKGRLIIQAAPNLSTIVNIAFF